MTVTNFLDLSKAFATIDHKIFLDKPEYYEINGVSLKFVIDSSIYKWMTLIQKYQL